VDEHITSQSIQSLVDKRVAAEVKKVLNTAQKSKKVSHSTDYNKYFLTHIISATEKSTQSNDFSEPKSGRHWKRRWQQEAQQAREEGWQFQDSREWSVKRPRRRIEEYRLQREGESSVADRYCSSSKLDTSFKYDNHYTYPDSLLTVPLPQAMSIIVAQIPIVVLESMRYRATIHTIDCDLPRDLSLHLLAGLKYMMPTQYNTKLISKSWDDFIDRLRYSVFFKARKPDLVPIKGQLPNYDPDYTVKRPQWRACQQLDRAFEFGILEGARAISHIVSNMFREFKTGGLYNSFFIAPPIHQIHDYLTQHQLVVLVTDKNLGCAVAPRT